MISILDRFTKPREPFIPRSVDDYILLRLAAKLHDLPAIYHYAALRDTYRQDQLLGAFRRVSQNAQSDANLGREFHQALTKYHGNGYRHARTRLLSVRVTRRSVGASIFTGTHLEYDQVRELSSAAPKAEASVTGFVNWLFQKFPVDSGALETVPARTGNRRAVLSQIVRERFRHETLPVFEVAKTDVLSSFGYPPPSYRPALRNIAAVIWPSITTKPSPDHALDAAALGLYVQTEQLFTSYQ